MRVEILSVKGTWRDIADACNTTIGIDPGDKEPSDKWKRTILRCEHSPIRKMYFNLKLHDVPSYVSVHLVRLELPLPKGRGFFFQRGCLCQTLSRSVNSRSSYGTNF